MTQETRVLVGICHTQWVISEFMISMMSMNKPPGTGYYFIGSKTLIDAARNELCRRAISENYTHLFFMDSDQTFPRDALLRLLADDKDIASGIYVQKTINKTPVIYNRKKDRKAGESRYEFIVDWDENGGPFEIDGCGAGCLLIKTEVLRKIGFPYFLIGTEDEVDKYIGEDYFFAEKAKKAGFKIYADPKVKCGHLDIMEFTVEEFFMQRDGKKSFLKSSPMETFDVKCIFCGHEFQDTMEGELLWNYRNDTTMPPPIVSCPKCKKDQPFNEKNKPSNNVKKERFS